PSPLGTYSSRVRWKLLPPKPKLDTEARRGWRLSRIQGRACVLTYSGPLERPSFGFGRSTLIVGGSTLWCSARTALSMPAAPAADLVWPICDFTEPSAHH